MAELSVTVHSLPSLVCGGARLKVKKSPHPFLKQQSLPTEGIIVRERQSTFVLVAAVEESFPVASDPLG